MPLSFCGQCYLRTAYLSVNMDTLMQSKNKKSNKTVPCTWTKYCTPLPGHPNLVPRPFQSCSQVLLVSSFRRPGVSYYMTHRIESVTEIWCWMTSSRASLCTEDAVMCDVCAISHLVINTRPSLPFCILQVIKPRNWERPGNVTRLPPTIQFLIANCKEILSHMM